MSIIRIKDTVQLKLLDSNVSNIKDNLASMGVTAGQTGRGVFARIAATHSGIINRNNFFYLPDRMRKGTGTFLTPYNKPILVNHNEDGEPIGRVVAAKYVDLSSGVRDAHKAKILTDSVKTDLFDKFVSGDMPLRTAVDYVSGYLNDSMLDDPEYEGLGYVEIIAHIKDETAAQKFLNGLYLTGSVAAATDHAFCSICKDDWSESGPCDHRPGKLYDKRKMYLIAGDFTYEHWAVVNQPADSNSKALEINNSVITDNAKVEDADFSGKLYEVNVDFLKDYKEEDVMAEKKKDKEPVAPAVKDTVVEPAVVPPAAPVVAQVTDKNTEESFDDFLTRILAIGVEDTVADKDEEKIYTLMLDEMKAAGLDEKTIEDAKLSTEKRKALAASTFCGPGRSFPVPDCAHVTAAKRMMSRYKGSGNKDSIMSCVERKAKSMGCTTKDAVVPTETPKPQDNMSHVSVLQQLLGVVQTCHWSSEESKPLDTADMGILQDLIEKMASMVTMDSFSKAVLNTKGLKLKQDKQLLDEIVKLETALGEVRDSLKKEQESATALRDETALTAKEMATLRDTLVTTKTQLKDVKIKQLSLLKTLKENKVVEVKDSAELTDAVLNTELETLTKDIDINKIADKLGDGTTRKPTGTVTNPAATVDNNPGNVKVEDVVSELKEIQDHYYELLFTSTQKAEEYKAREMQRMFKEGKIPVTK